jgi:carbon storage regulator CsrA
MLVIRCREGETVSIGDNVELIVLAAGAGRVKLGFKAPASVLVTRGCIELTRQQNQAAANNMRDSLICDLRPYLSGTASDGHGYVLSVQEFKEKSAFDSTSRGCS